MEILSLIKVFQLLFFYKKIFINVTKCLVYVHITYISCMVTLWNAMEILQ